MARLAGRARAAPGKAHRAARAPAPLKVDAERFPHVERNPGLERALRIRQALDKGMPRDEAVRLADDAMGPRSPVGHAVPGPKRPASGARARTQVKGGRATTSPPRRRQAP